MCILMYTKISEMCNTQISEMRNTQILEMRNTQIPEMRNTHAALSCAAQERELHMQLHILHQGSKMCMECAQNLFLHTHGHTSTLHKCT